MIRIRSLGAPNTSEAEAIHPGDGCLDAVPGRPPADMLKPFRHPEIRPWLFGLALGLGQDQKTACRNIMLGQTFLDNINRTFGMLGQTISGH